MGSSYLPFKPSKGTNASRAEDTRGTLTGLSSWARNSKLAEDLEVDAEDYLREQQLRKLCGIGSIDISNPTTELSYRRNSVGIPIVRDTMLGRISASTLDTNAAINQMYSASKVTNKSDKPTAQPDASRDTGQIGPIGRGRQYWSFTSGDTTSNNSSARAMMSKGGLITTPNADEKAQSISGATEDGPESVKKAKAESTPSRYQTAEGFNLPIMHNWSQKKHPKLEKVADVSPQEGLENFQKVSKALFGNVAVEDLKVSGRHSFLRDHMPASGGQNMHQSYVGHNKHSRRFTQGYEEFRAPPTQHEDDDYFHQSERKLKPGRQGESRIRTEESQVQLNSSMNNFSRKRTQPVFESEQYKIIKDKVGDRLIAGVERPKNYSHDPEHPQQVHEGADAPVHRWRVPRCLRFLLSAHRHQGSLPVNRKNGCNIGYAFINFNIKAAMPSFIERFEGFKWQLGTVSRKVCKISYARIQGLEQLQLHFMESRVMDQQVSL